MDWLDRSNAPSGIQLFWPFSPAGSFRDLFVQTALHPLFSTWSLKINLFAMAWETAILSPLLVALWLVRVKALTRFSAQLTRGDHPAQQGARPVL